MIIHLLSTTMSRRGCLLLWLSLAMLPQAPFPLRAQSTGTAPLTGTAPDNRQSCRSVSYVPVSSELAERRIKIWKYWAKVSDKVFFKQYLATTDPWLRNHVPSILPIRVEDGHARLTSHFGWRMHPIVGKNKFHNGIDLAAYYKQPVYSTAQGVVEKVGYDRIIGNYIVVSHAGLFKTIYGHLSSTLVKVGQWVDREQLIGLVGSTGRSTGYHLHYSVKKNNVMVNANQYLFLRFGLISQG